MLCTSSLLLSNTLTTNQTTYRVERCYSFFKAEVLFTTLNDFTSERFHTKICSMKYCCLVYITEHIDNSISLNNYIIYHVYLFDMVQLDEEREEQHVGIQTETESELNK